jgi:dolichol-phosphate mannosyltransferase
MDKLISVVVPSYNEEKNISLLYEKLTKVLKIYSTYEILFVDDGSSDATLDEIKKIARKDHKVKFLSFSRNFGHQNALKAGLDHAKGDCLISLDADLQHPPELIPQMVEKWQENYDVVYTLRQDGKDIGFFKRNTSAWFYRIINLLSDIHINQGAADYRLMDRKVVNVFRNDINEYYLFMRGLVSWVGFRQYGIEYVPAKRQNENSKYNIRKMISLAIKGVTSFSAKPLRLAMLFGFIISFLAFVYGLYAVYMAVFTNKAVIGWASLLVSVLFVGGIQMILLGILGEYIGKLFFESKKRPVYIVKDTNVSNDKR